MTAAIDIPTIGIGAGPSCDGQVLVCYDFLGMFRGMRPKFVKRFAEVGDAIVDATQRFVAETQSRSFPRDEHSFGVAAKRLVPSLENNEPVPASTH